MWWVVAVIAAWLVGGLFICFLWGTFAQFSDDIAEEEQQRRRVEALYPTPQKKGRRRQRGAKKNQ